MDATVRLSPCVLHAKIVLDSTIARIAIVMFDENCLGVRPIGSVLLYARTPTQCVRFATLLRVMAVQIWA